MEEKKDFHRLRWRFIFATKPDHVGLWNGGSGKPEFSASRVNKSGMIAACIETENLRTYEVKRVLTLEGHKYATAKWDGFASLPGMGINGSFTFRPTVYALAFLTNDKRYTVDVFGDLNITDLDDETKKFKLEEHSIIGV